MDGITIFKKRSTTNSTDILKPEAMDLLKIDNTNENTIQESFFKIAKTLFENYRLRVNDNYYKLLEIEFYYFLEGLHEDIHTHMTKPQLTYGKWHFHDSGVDISFGDGITFGGILIRSIAGNSAHEISKSNIISGPLVVRDKIIEGFHGVFDNSPNFFQLEKHDSERVVALVGIKRHGLLKKEKDIDDKFRSRKYRFINEEYLIIIKDKENIVKQLYNDGEITIEKALKLSGRKENFFK